MGEEETKQTPPEITQQYVELEAPPYLEEGQNLYDQPPFSEALLSLSAEYGSDINTLRKHLGALAGEMNLDFPGKNISEMVYIHSVPKDIRGAMIRLNDILQDYPYWFPDFW